MRIWAALNGGLWLWLYVRFICGRVHPVVPGALHAGTQTITSRERAMFDPSSSPDTESTDVEPDRRPLTGLPRWVKVSAVVVLALVVLFVVLQLTGVEPGGHDPGNRGDHGLGGSAPREPQGPVVDADETPSLVGDVST
jgi:hypothetical protein